ncbi:ATP-binding protein [Paenibacillus thalictri]|uniref:histidine kinase n=1 Tax=Paenibacillus thalictri TaxID=2527873 RepID=A0A4V2J3A0_9BACL|nr:ATP-binding protein [Paenibacillus thalictri]TBL70778.1 response regulator [Paenibacillus thalictri]
MMKTNYSQMIKHVALIMLFLVILLGLRWFWFSFFVIPEHPRAIQGVLDLRGFELSRPITLDGEWEFYPERLLSHDDFAQRSAAPWGYMQVPGDWRGGFADAKNDSYGYGTYRLRILVDQPLQQPYAFWVQKIETSSAVEINGRVMAEFGQPAERAELHTPYVTAYTVYYETDAKEIELIVRAANFERPNEGGLIKSVYFGSDAAIDTRRWYSIGFQLVTFLILLLHALYAGILYIFNVREKSFLVFVLLMLSAGISVISDHDNLLLRWIPFDYAWAAKIRLLSYMWLSFFMLLMARILAAYRPGTRWFQAYSGVLFLYSVFIAAAPIQLVFYSVGYKVFSFLYLAPLVWFVYMIGRMTFQNQRDAHFILFAATSVLSSVIWGVVNYNAEVTRMYYPIDVIAAIIGFSSFWFKKYFRHSEENFKLTAQLKRADKLKDQFLANTSHELRTPLHGIMNIAQTMLIREKDELDGKRSKDTELLLTISRRMSHMLDDLLDIARLQDKRILLKPEPLRLQSVVSGVMGMLEYMTERKPVRLQMEIAEQVPPVWADEKRLVQILFNLVHNALKYTDEGTVAVTAEVIGEAAVIHVKDTGIGMDEPTQARIFMPYEQGPRGAGESGGIGLGLSICKQLVELHGSELTVNSEPDKGTVFSFALPLAGEHPQQQIAAARTAEENDEGTAEGLFAPYKLDNRWPALQPVLLSLHGQKPNILAVDDDPVNLKVLESILSTDEYYIQPAASALEALELLRTASWDLLIVDVMMPHMSGYELTRKVRELFSTSELPILLLTARGEPADIYAGFLSGANDYVTKPADALELKYRVWSLTALKQSVNERLRMEAAYLQAQIHPHFLFNTLNSIMALSDIDTEKMQQLGEAFISYLQVSFDMLNSGERVPLSYELELVRSYLYIEQERFGQRVSVEWEVDPDVSLAIPPLTLQPLVENAVNHGLLSKSKGGRLLIRIVRQDGAVLFEVADNGIGIRQDTISHLLDYKVKDSGGIGLSNTHRRLAQMYGKGLTIESKPGEGTKVFFCIPDETGQV